MSTEITYTEAQANLENLSEQGMLEGMRQHQRQFIETK